MRRTRTPAETAKGSPLWAAGMLVGVGLVWVGLGGRGGCLCCNMMFILVMYLTVEDKGGLSVWLYEKNLNTNTKTFVDILLWKRLTFMRERKKKL